ncbi:MAG: 3-dehydroquinate synthase family protein, partial [Chthoniobacterales bacterium]
MRNATGGFTLMEAKSIEVQAGQNRYEVLIGPGLLRQIGPLVRRLFAGSKGAIISDPNVVQCFGETVNASLRQVGLAMEMITVPGGETAKSMAQATELCERLSAAGLDRTSLVVSLGGGVLNDLAGFVAAIYFRGIPYVSVPTTLLAQVDSCIGGKTAVNSRAGKNLIGAFHHPALVVADTDTLQT